MAARRRTGRSRSTSPSAATTSSPLPGCCAGAALLHIPDNYYADLDAREELPADLLRDLREHSVMYDADRTCAFFHFYTALVGSSLFFEVVQRTQAYDGYGAVNAPVRMAAQRSRR